MKSLHLFLSLLGVLILAPSTVQCEVMPYDSKVYSPDKSKSVLIKLGDREVYYKFKNEHNNKTVSLVALANPVFGLIWSQDPSYLYSVVHVARGRDLIIIYIDKNLSTKYMSFEPVDHFNDYYVLDWHVGSKGLHLVFKLTLLRDNGQRYAYYKCECDVDPVTVKPLNMNKTAITFDEYSNLKSKF